MNWEYHPVAHIITTALYAQMGCFQAGLIYGGQNFCNLIEGNTNLMLALVTQTMIGEFLSLCCIACGLFIDAIA